MKNFFQRFLAIGFFLFLVFFVIGKQSTWISDVQMKVQVKNFDVNNIQYVKIAGVKLKVGLALTPEAQERGLSERNELKENEGMLFVFNHAGKYPFWMKDMDFPIDIIWIAGEDFRNLRVVYIKKDAKPESYPETFLPDQDAGYVLEVVSLFSEKNNLKRGDKVEFLSS